MALNETLISLQSSNTAPRKLQPPTLQFEKLQQVKEQSTNSVPENLHSPKSQLLKTQFENSVWPISFPAKERLWNS